MSELAFRVVNTGSQRKGEQLTLGRCYRITHVQLGSGGHNESDGLPLSVDVTKATVQEPITSEMELPQTAFLQIGPRRTQITVELPTNVANGTISTIGLFGTIVFVPDGDDQTLVGTRFLYAVCNTQKFTKTAAESKKLKLFLNH